MCEKTLFDYISTFLPILLSALLIIENLIFHFRNKKLQQEIHNRDIRLRKHDDILKIYSVYYEVSDFLYANNIVLGVKEGNVPYIMNCRFHLVSMKNNILRNLDLAALMLKNSDNELFKIVKDRFEFGTRIIDKYIDYIDGDFASISIQAWSKILQLYPFVQQYNYASLYQNQSCLNDFHKLCETSITLELDDLLKQYAELHKYDKFDIYFEKYFDLNELK